MALDDDKLRNLQHELGREINQQAVVMNEVRARLDAVRLEIQRRGTIASNGVHISDHAIVRFLERHRGVDITAIREEIAGMAKRSGKLDSGEQYVRAPDGTTGLTMGINGISNVVTTVFCEGENTVFNVPPALKTPLTSTE